MGKIILIRHGQASFGTSDYDRLSELGKIQSDITGRFFARTGCRFDAVYAGTMRRQKETAEIVLTGKGISDDGVSTRCLEAFDEYDFMAIIRSQLPDLIRTHPEASQGLATDAAFRKYFGKVMKKWASGDHDHPGVETFSQYIERIVAGLKMIAENHRNDETVAVFTSGGVIAISLHPVWKIPPWDALKTGWQIPNCSVSSILFGDKGFRFETFNSFAHLEQEGVPGLITYR